jgi:alpha-tubulin suppressor-like RCC1 family protein
MKRTARPRKASAAAKAEPPKKRTKSFAEPTATTKKRVASTPSKTNSKTKEPPKKKTKNEVEIEAVVDKKNKKEGTSSSSSASVPVVRRVLPEAANILTVGNGDIGQLGLGEDITSRKKPALIKELAGKRILKVTFYFCFSFNDPVHLLLLLLLSLSFALLPL